MPPSFLPIVNAVEKALSAKLLISPFAGEMSGRTEGGVKELNLSIRVSAIASSICEN